MGSSNGFLAVGARYTPTILERSVNMVSWATVVVAVSLMAMIYFLVRGIRLALTSKELPDPDEGDYEIKVVGKLKGGRLLTVMSPRRTDEKEVSK